MSEIAESRFECAGCGKSYRWKPELAAKRVKCKCGQVMTVPHSPPGQEPEPDDLYDLAPSGEDDAASMFSKLKSSSPAPVSSQPVAMHAGVPLAYQHGPTQRDRERSSAAVLLDMKRDVHVPVALLIAGFALYVGYYAWRYEMSGAAIGITGFGLGVLIALKTAILVGFAFVVAGPLGVSFGGIWTAILKLAAIAVFADGVTVWVDWGITRIGGGAGVGGLFGYGVISFPVALGIYWGLMVYLFSMDPGDSWLVVIILAVFDYIVRTVLMMLLLRAVLGFGGITPPPGAVPAFGGAPPAAVDPMSEQIAELKAHNLLKEAREFIAGGRQMALTNAVDGWYAAGCKNVWFAVSRDINGRISPESLIVELPADPAARETCYAILKAYYDEHDIFYDPEDLDDDGSEKYLTMDIPG